MKTLTTALGILVVTLCHAADFPLAGGDIASPTDWGQAVPGSSDDVVLPSSGTYELGGDVAFKTLAAGSGASSLVFDFAKGGNHTVTLHGTTAREVLKPVVNDDGTAVFKGGVLKFATSVNVAMPWKKRAKTVLTDGCVVTNAATFDLGYGATFSRLDVTNGASVYASVFNLNEWGGSSNVLSVTAGGVVSVNGDIRSDVNDITDRVSGNGFFVSGEGSKLRQTNTGAGIKLGYKCSGNWLCVEDGGECYDAGKLQIGTSAQSVRNEAMVRNGGILSVNKLQFASSNNKLEVDNASFQATGSVELGNAASVTGNVMTVTGPEAVFNCPGNVFGLGCGNLFELVDGATWDIGGTDITLMSGASSNVLSVAGGAVLANTNAPAAGATLKIGADNTALGYNRIEILDGAVVNLEGCFVRGVNNAVVVSNATLRIDGTGYGIWLGHGSNSSGNKLIVQGATPSVYVKEYKSSNGSAIRFEIPAEGYAEGYVPMTMKLDSALNTATERFEIDCAAWVANPDAVRKLVLMRTTTDITSAQADWILAQNADLPESVRLKVTSSEVIIQKRGGFILSFR